MRLPVSCCCALKARARLQGARIAAINYMFDPRLRSAPPAAVRVSKSMAHHRFMCSRAGVWAACTKPYCTGSTALMVDDAIPPSSTPPAGGRKGRTHRSASRGPGAGPVTEHGQRWLCPSPTSGPTSALRPPGRPAVRRPRIPTFTPRGEPGTTMPGLGPLVHGHPALIGRLFLLLHVGTVRRSGYRRLQPPPVLAERGLSLLRRAGAPLLRDRMLPPEWDEAFELFLSRCRALSARRRPSSSASTLSSVITPRPIRWITPVGRGCRRPCDRPRQCCDLGLRCSC